MASAPPAAEPRAPAPGATAVQPGSGALAIYFAAGIAFGVVLIKAEVVSWFRIQEMFRFQGWHMFGIFATALPTAIVSVALLRRFHPRTVGGGPITIPPKVMGRGHRYVLGGVTFGLGWAFTGACPGPLFALLGSGVGPVSVVLVSAVAGTWIYAALRPRLPH